MAEGLTALFANAIAAVFAVALPAWSQSSTTQDHNCDATEKRLHPRPQGLNVLSNLVRWLPEQFGKAAV
jgi:hypothetical protein